MEKGLGKIEKIKVLHEMPKDWQEARERLLEHYENNLEGLDLGRVSSFLLEKGMQMSDIVVFNKGDESELQEILGESYKLSAFEDEIGGRYDDNLDLILVPRIKGDQDKESLSYLEGSIVHEAVHSFSATKKMRQEGNKVTRLRSGYVVNCRAEKQPWGWYLEEGLADVFRAEYTERYLDDHSREKIDELIKVAVGNSSPLKILYTPEIGTKYSISKKYLVTDRSLKRGFTWTGSSIASTGLEMIFEKEPKLLQVLIDARTDIEKLREIPKLLNAIKPGLYIEIQKCGYSDEEFARVQNIIKEAIENSK